MQQIAIVQLQVHGLTAVRRWLWSVLAVLLLVAPALAAPASADSRSAEPDEIDPFAGSAGPADLAEFLDENGRLTLPAGFSGSLDPTGFQLVSGKGEAPRFAPVLEKNAGVDADARWSGFGGIPNGCNGAVRAMVTSASGELYLGGDFTLCGDTPANYIVRFDPGAGTWTALGSGAGNGVGGGSFPAVYALAVSGSNLYVGGFFTQANAGADVAANNIARWDGSTWHALGSGGGNGVNSFVSALAVSDSNLYVGGSFTQANVGAVVAASFIARWDGSIWNALGSGGGNGVSSTVRALALSGSELYVGGDFTQANVGAGLTANRIARWDGSAWHALGSGGGNGVNGTVFALAVSGSDLYVGGNFSQASAGAAVAANRIARWDGSSWHALGSGTGLGYVSALVLLDESTLFVGGNFGNAGSKPSSSIAHYTITRLDLDTLTPATTEPSMEATISGSGRFVVFESLDPVLHTPCPGIPNPPRLCGAGGDACPPTGPLHVYRLDLEIGCIDLVSTDQEGVMIKLIPHHLGKGTGEEPLGKPSASADGSLVAFVTDDAVTGKLWGEGKSARKRRQKGGGLSVLLRDMLAGTTRLIGASADTASDPDSGQPVSGGRPKVAPDGRSVVYTGLLGSRPTVMQARFNEQGGIDTFCVACKPTGGSDPGSFTLPLDGFSHNATVSANGKVVAYQTVASDAAPSSCDNGATNTSVILRNMQDGSTRTVNQPQGTGCAPGSAGKPKLDYSGTRVVFESTQPLTAGATARPEVYLFDAASNRMQQISVDDLGGQVDAGSGEPALSGDGRWAAFTSMAKTGFGPVLPAEAPTVNHIVVRELRENDVRRLSEAFDGAIANGDSFRPSLSYVGNVVVFDSVASNLSAADTNGTVSDVFLRANPLGPDLLFGSGFE